MRLHEHALTARSIALVLLLASGSSSCRSVDDLAEHDALIGAWTPKVPAYDDELLHHVFFKHKGALRYLWSNGCILYQFALVADGDRLVHPSDPTQWIRATPSDPETLRIETAAGSRLFVRAQDGIYAAVLDLDGAD